jgi:hypothetical protein
VVLHYDQDFDLIAAITGQPMNGSSQPERSPQGANRGELDQAVLAPEIGW